MRRQMDPALSLGSSGHDSDPSEQRSRDSADGAHRALAAQPLDDHEVVVESRDEDGNTVAVRAEGEHGLRGATRRQFAVLYACLAVTDGLCFALGLVLTARVQLAHVGPRVWTTILVSPVVVAAVFSWLGLYHSHVLSPAEEFRRLMVGVTFVSVAVVTFSFWADVTYSRLWVAMSWALALVFTLASRRFWHWAIAHERSRGRFTFRTAIVGGNGEASYLADVLGRRNLGFAPVGFVTVDSTPPPTGLPVLGSIRTLREVVRSQALDALFVATTAVGANEIAKVQKVARREGAEVHVTANLPELLASRLSVEPLGGVMALSVRPVRLTGAQAAAKRAFDLVLGSIALVVTAPVWLLAAALIKATSRGPVFFTQERVGRSGRRFTLLKFRTMVVDAEAMLVQLRDRNEASGPLFKLRDDPRITRVGRWLRRYSVDELPQLLNVLRGQMSLVGPRPPLQSEVDAYEEWQRDRLEVRPGITGLWQVSGRSDLAFDEYVRMDLFYIENWSLAFDLYILAKTIPAAVGAKGAR
jgi:exopolysaccharide biosynthesis polyprenyl glycosylphosphotransferase